MCESSGAAGAEGFRFDNPIQLRLQFCSPLRVVADLLQFNPPVLLESEDLHTFCTLLGLVPSSPQWAEVMAMCGAANLLCGLHSEAMAVTEKLLANSHPTAWKLALALASASEPVGSRPGAAEGLLNLSSGSDLLADAAKVCPPEELPALLRSFSQGSPGAPPQKMGACSGLASTAGQTSSRSARMKETRGYSCGGKQPSSLCLAAVSALGLKECTPEAGSDAASGRIVGSSRCMQIWDEASAEEWKAADERKRWGELLLAVDRDVAVVLLDAASMASAPDAGRAPQSVPAQSTEKPVADVQQDSGPQRPATSEERRAAAKERVAKAKAARAAAAGGTSQHRAVASSSEAVLPEAEAVPSNSSARRRAQAAGFLPDAAVAAPQSGGFHASSGSQSPPPEDTAARFCSLQVFGHAEDPFDECPETEPGGAGGALTSAIRRIRQACPSIGMSAGQGGARLADEVLRCLDASPATESQLIQAVAGVDVLREAGVGPSMLALRSARRVIADAISNSSDTSWSGLPADLAALVPWLGPADAGQLLIDIFNDDTAQMSQQLEVLKLLAATSQAGEETSQQGQAGWAHFRGLVEQAKALGTLRAAFAEHLRCENVGRTRGSRATLLPSGIRLDSAHSLEEAQAMWLDVFSIAATEEHGTTILRSFLPVAEILCPRPAASAGLNGLDLR